YRLKHGNRDASPSLERAVGSATLSSQPPEASRTQPAQATQTQTTSPSKQEKVVAFEPKQTASESSLAAAVSASPLSIHAATVPSATETRAISPAQRKAERVSMTGTNAYAVLGESSSRRAKVLDLGFGGVALELDSKEPLPNSFLAVLHVPILPPVRVS